MLTITYNILVFEKIQQDLCQVPTVKGRDLANLGKLLRLNDYVNTHMYVHIVVKCHKRVMKLSNWKL